MAGSIKLYGPSGYTEIAADASADDNVLTLPSIAGSLLTAEGGKILQIVRATDTTERTTNSTSFVDGSLSVTITPQKNDSVVLLFYSVVVQKGDANEILEVQVTDSSNNGISGASAGRLSSSVATTHVGVISLLGYATPATTSATTYKARFRSLAGNAVLLRNDVNVGQLYAIEVSA